MSRSEISAVAAGAALGAVVAILWKRSAALGRTSVEAAPAEVVEAPARPVEPRRQVAAPPPRAESAALPVVLVTGAGEAAGVCVIRALKAAGARVLAADPDDTAVGLQLADAGGTVPRADEPGFVAALCELAAALGAQAIVSTVAEELTVLAEGSAELAVAGLASWLPDPAAVRTCLDKSAFAQTLAAAGIPHPQIVQSRLEGLEFTIDALVDRGGGLAAAVPRWRLETAAGTSTKGRTFEDPQLVSLAQRLVSALGLEGPVTIRGFMLSSNGRYCFTEVTPSFSGGLSLSLAAGADLVCEYVRGILGLPLRRERLVHQPGVTVERFYDEVILNA